jgi:hypothetical protein
MLKRIVFSSLTEKCIDGRLAASLQNQLQFFDRWMFDDWVTVLHGACSCRTNSPSFKICYSEWSGSFCCRYLQGLRCDMYPLYTRLFDEKDCTIHIWASSFLWLCEAPGGCLTREYENKALYQQQTFPSLVVNLRPASIFQCSVLYIMNFQFNARHNVTICKTL